jgi:hypothetical protein
MYLRREACTEFCWGDIEERDYLGDPGVDGRVILRWIFKKWDVMVWNGSSWLRIGTDWREFVIALMNHRVP